MKQTRASAPWKRKRPKGPVTHLTTKEKAEARARATRAGRRYPNLVDNMAIAARKKGTQKRSTKARSKRASASKRADPEGGLTEAGREYFARTEGAHLKAGVKKRMSEMTPSEMRRKGSWAVRFYGRSGALPPLTNDKGEPTRFALTAAAWGEPIPRTVTAARRIAAKGRRLLARYERTKTR